MTAFVPPLTQRLVDRFGLSPVDVVPPAAGEAAMHSPERAHRLWLGPAALDDGYDFIEVLVEEFGLRPDPRFDEWPAVVEAFRVHDPKDDPPDEADRLFQFVRVTFADGVVYVALYTTKGDAEADARAPEGGER